MNTEKQIIDQTPCCSHWSDCAVHNAPAYLPGPCDCGRGTEEGIDCEDGLIGGTEEGVTFGVAPFGGTHGITKEKQI